MMMMMMMMMVMSLPQTVIVVYQLDTYMYDNQWRH